MFLFRLKARIGGLVNSWLAVGSFMNDQWFRSIDARCLMKVTIVKGGTLLLESPFDVCKAICPGVSKASLIASLISLLVYPLSMIFFSECVNIFWSDNKSWHGFWCCIKKNVDVLNQFYGYPNIPLIYPDPLVAGQHTIKISSYLLYIVLFYFVYDIVHVLMKKM